MRKAETIIAVLQERGKAKSSLEKVYRLLYNQNLYLKAYSNIYPNKGAMTAGVTDETADSMSLDKIDDMIAEIRTERFRWTPVKRIYIPKKNGEMRPLGSPTWKDKLLQEVIRLILDAYYDRKFWKYSHGFRTGKGCHTALRDIGYTWKGTTWFIEGDIEKCFDQIDHEILIQIIGRDIKDNRFLRLLKNLLKAGYMEKWKYNATYSGTPQGGIVSPLLANIYMHEFDTWVAKDLIPRYTVGERRKTNTEYSRVRYKISSIKKGKSEGCTKELRRVMKTLPSQDTNDSNYRRLSYVRYADDTLFGFIGSKAEAEEIKQEIEEWLSTNLRLKLSKEKTLITHAKTENAYFLGYEICTMQKDYQLDSRKSRNSNGRISLRIPNKVLSEKARKYQSKGKAAPRGNLMADSDFDIVSRYQSEYRGLVNYYIMADNVCHLDYVKWVMETSMLRTLAMKHRSSVKKMAKRYKSKHNGMPCIEVTIPREKKKPLIARFGAIPLKVNKKANIKDRKPQIWNQRTEIIQRLLADECEVCGANERIEVHHVRKLSDLKKKYRGRKTPSWVKHMAARNRKTMMVCKSCHLDIHSGRPLKWKNLLESRVH